MYSSFRTKLAVQDPRQFTIFKCLPKWIMIFNSDIKARMYIISALGLTILTATVVDLSKGSIKTNAG